MARSGSRRPRRARIILSLVAAGLIVVLVMAIQTPLIWEWLCYRAEPGVLDGEYGLTSVLLVKRYEVIPGPRIIHRLYGPDRQQLLECNKRSFAWLHMDDALVIYLATDKPVELTLDKHGTASLAPELRYDGGAARKTVVVLDGAVRKFPEQSLEELLSQLAKATGLEIRLTGLRPEVARKKVHLDAGKLGAALSKTLAPIGHTWGIQPDGIVQLLPAGKRAPKGDVLAVLNSLRTIRSQSASMEFQGQALVEILNFMNVITDIPFVFDESALKDVKITCKAQSMRLGSILTQVLKRRGARYFVRCDGKIAVLLWPPRPAATPKPENESK